MKLLITGGAGFIGSNYVNDLVNRETQWSEIIVLDSLTYAGNKSNLEFALTDRRLKLIKGDIRDTKLVHQVMQNVHTVIHFAAESHVDRSILNPNEFVSTNVLGTAILLEHALRNEVEKFLHISTDEVYGSILNGNWNEISPVAPNSPYSASKASSDLLVLSYYKTFGLPIFISRCSNNFGPFQFPEKFIPLAITNLLDGLPIPVYGSGLNSRDWLHVADHCKAINLILEKGTIGEIYNIGGGTEMTNIDVAKLLCKLLDRNDTFIDYVEDRKGHDFRYSVDYKKISSDCGYVPTKDFQESILETIYWYQKNKVWWNPLKN